MKIMRDETFWRYIGRVYRAGQIAGMTEEQTRMLLAWKEANRQHRGSLLDQQIEDILRKEG